MKHFRIFGGFILLFLVACAPQASVVQGTPTAIVVAGDVTAVPPTPTLATPVEPTEPVATETAVLPTATPMPDVQPTETAVLPTATQVVNEAALAEDLKETMGAILQSENGTDAPFGGYEDLFVERLPIDHQLSFWMVHSVGFRSFDPLLPHFVAIFLRDGEVWQEVGRVELEYPDILFGGGIMGEELNGRYWLQIESGVGAHGGCFDLLRFDQGILTHDISHCYSSPGGAGEFLDVNEDGWPEVVLNASDQYVYCYACGITYSQFILQTFDGVSWRQIELATLSGDSEAVTLNNEAVRLAQAGVWKAASETMARVDSSDPTIVWNRVIIEQHADDFLWGVERGFFPLIELTFYGDYARAVDEMRALSIDEIFTQEGNLLLAGTPAEGYGDLTSERMLDVLNPAIVAVPDAAAAYYLRGWARFLINPADPLALADIEQAAVLAPEDSLFVESLAFLRSE